MQLAAVRRASEPLSHGLFTHSSVSVADDRERQLVENTLFRKFSAKVEGSGAESSSRCLIQQNPTTAKSEKVTVLHPDRLLGLEAATP